MLSRWPSGPTMVANYRIIEPTNVMLNEVKHLVGRYSIAPNSSSFSGWTQDGRRHEPLTLDARKAQPHYQGEVEDAT